MSYDINWRYVGEEGEPPFNCDWKNVYDFNPLRFIKGYDGVVRIEGTVESGDANDYIFILPIGYRSDRYVIKPIFDNFDVTYCTAKTNGEIRTGKHNNTNIDLYYYLAGEAPTTTSEGTTIITGSIYGTSSYGI